MCDDGELHFEACRALCLELTSRRTNPAGRHFTGVGGTEPSTGSSAVLFHKSLVPAPSIRFLTVCRAGSLLRLSLVLGQHSDFTVQACFGLPRHAWLFS